MGSGRGSHERPVRDMAMVVLASPEGRVGSRIDGRYRLLALLGRGGMGVVYEAVHEQTGRTVALKTLHPSLSRDAVASQRFLREIRTAGMFEHPNLTDVLDAGTDVDGTLYVVMPRLRGRTLDEVLQAGPLTPELTAGVVLPVLEALAFMHARGAIHRDLKPSNVFLHVDANGTTTVKLLDFGLARLVVEERGASTQGVIGTPHYMAPEQARGRGGVGPPADVWSVGVLAYECLTGDVPFGGTTTEALAAILSGQATPPLPADVPPPLVRGIERALVRDPAARPAHAAASLAVWREAVFEARLRPELPRFAIPRFALPRFTGPSEIGIDTPTLPSEPVRVPAAGTPGPSEVVSAATPPASTRPSSTAAIPPASGPSASRASSRAGRPTTRWLLGAAGVAAVGGLAWLAMREGVPTPAEAASPPVGKVVWDAGVDAGFALDASSDATTDAPADAQLDSRVAEPLPTEPRPAEPVRGVRRRRLESAAEPATPAPAEAPRAAPRGPNDTPIVPWR